MLKLLPLMCDSDFASDTKGNVMEKRNSNLKYMGELYSSVIYLLGGNSGPHCHYIWVALLHIK
jgi:hypothetical protein